MRIAILLLMALVLIAGCSKSEPIKTNVPTTAASTKSTEAKVEAKKEPLTAKAVVDAFKAAGITIGDVISYTAETDPNALLGRPGQYTEKINWADAKVEQTDSETPIGGSVEIFKNKQDRDARFEYIEQFSDTPMLVQYMYAGDLALVRIDKELTPAQAEEYKKAFEDFIK